MQYLDRNLVDKFAETFAGAKVGFSAKQITEYFSKYCNSIKSYDHYGFKPKRTELFIESSYQLSPKYQYYAFNDLTWVKHESKYEYPCQNTRQYLRTILHDFIGGDAIGIRFSNIRESEFRQDWITCQTRLQRKNISSSITAARTMLETLFKTILYERGAKTKSNGDLGKLLKEVEGVLNFNPGENQAEHQIFHGLASVITGISKISNDAGDRHGTVGGKSINDPYFAQLCINAAGTIGISFIEMHLLGSSD